MHAKHKAKFVRLWMMDRIKTVAAVAVFFVPLVVLLVFIGSEERAVGDPETGTYLRNQTLQREDGAKHYWMIELSDNAVLRLRARTLVQPSAGDLVCVRRVIGQNTGLAILRFESMGACE